MKLLLVIGLLISSLSLTAQTVISGSIRDAANRGALDFVNVSLLASDSITPIDGTMSNSNGDFELTVAKKGDYLVLISMVGYQEVYRPVNIADQESIKLGKIYLTESARELQGVEIVAQGSQMRFELDKKVFTVDQAIASAGGSVTDVLQNIPSVDVDQEGNISLRNSEAVEIWINGKPAGLTAENRADVLQQMPAGTIKEIEVITNPSAKYSPEGTAGIINLVTSANRNTGYYGSLTGRINYSLAAPWTTPPSANLSFNFNFTKGIVDGYFNLGYHYHSSNGSSYNDRYNFSTTDTTRLIKSGGNYRRGGGMFIRAGLDFHVTDRSIIGLSGFGMVSVPGDKTNGAFSNINQSPTHYDLYDITHYEAPQSTNNTDTLLRSYDRNQRGSGTHPGGNVMLDWRFKINSQHNLSMSAQFSQFHWNQDMFYETQEQGAVTSLQEQLNENMDRTVQLKADYEWKPTNAMKLEAGWQTDLAWRSTHADAWEGNARATQLKSYYNDFTNNEQTHALYITFGSRFWDKLSVQAGLRGEYFRRHLVSDYFNSTEVKETAAQDTSYFQLFPSVYINYSFDNGHELQANYTRRIDRPRGHQINPRQDFSDSTAITYGNPNLLPQYSSSVELNYLKHWERHTLSAGLFYRYADDVTQRISYRDNEVLRGTWINLGKRHEAGIELVAKDKFFKEILNLTTSLSFYYNRLDQATYTPILNGTEYDQVVIPEQNIFAFSARINIGLMFTKTFTGQISAYYRSPRVRAQGTSSHSYGIDLSLRKTFLNKTLALALNVQDLLNSRARQNTTFSDSFWQYTDNRWNSRNISLSLTWNFGNMNNTKKNEKMANSNSMSDSYYSGEGADE